MDRHMTGTKQWVLVHEPGSCVGEFCAVHRPMPGPWELWPTNWNEARRLMERVCPCGYKHPAAEEYQIHNYGALIHTCCRVPWHRCAPELHYDRQHRRPDFPGDLNTIDGEVVDSPKEISS